MPPWSHATTEELLGLAVDTLAGGDARGLTLLTLVLARECGAEFAATVAGALSAGAPLDAFDFLPAPRVARQAAPAPTAAPDPGPVQPPAPSPPPEVTAKTPPAAAVASQSDGGPAPRRGHERTRHRTLTPGEPPALPDTGYVTAIEVAAHFGVSVKAVYRWMATGRIRSERRPGGSYRIPAEQFTGSGVP